MAKQSNFFGEFLKERKMVGALSPSSKFLMKRMVAPIDFQKADVIVELGPGNGIFTKGILERMKQTTVLYSFELNEQFYDFMKKDIQDDRLKLINDSAVKINEYLKADGIEKVDYIVSSLPFTVIPKEIKFPIMRSCIKSMNPDTVFIQFQYSLNAKKMFDRLFGEVKLDFTPMNIPPAFIYKCKL